jgi:putative transposase
MRRSAADRLAAEVHTDHPAARALDNIFVERLWRTVKYEHTFLMDYNSVPELEAGLGGYFRFYNDERLHQSLGYRTPAEVHYAT